MLFVTSSDDEQPCVLEHLDRDVARQPARQRGAGGGGRSRPDRQGGLEPVHGGGDGDDASHRGELRDEIGVLVAKRLGFAHQAVDGDLLVETPPVARDVGWHEDSPWSPLFEAPEQQRRARSKLPERFRNGGVCSLTAP
jgi:hypothetical protein